MRDKASNSDENALIKKARKAGARTASFSSPRPTEEALKTRHPNYTEEHIKAYLTAYDKKMANINATGTANKIYLKKAIKAGYEAAACNSRRPNEDILKSRNPAYTDEQIQAYLSAYDKKKAKIKATGTENRALIKKAKSAGLHAALDNSPRPTEEILKSRNPNYTDEHVQAYLRAYDEKMAKIKAMGTENKSYIKKALKAGSEAATINSPRPTEETIKNRNPAYTDEQIQAYLSAYDKRMAKIKASGTENKALIKKARSAGLHAALDNYSRPTEEILKSRNPNYTEKQVQAYLTAYDEKMDKIKAMGMENKACFKKVRKAGYEAATFNSPRPTEETLKIRYPDYTDEQIQAYLTAYDEKMAKIKATGTENKSLIKKAKIAGYSAAALNLTRPTEDELKKRNSNYTEEQVRTYLIAFDKKQDRIKTTGINKNILIKKAKMIGRAAASLNTSRPTEEVLKARHPLYTDEEINAYYSAYDKKIAKIKASGTDSKALIIQARNSGLAAASNNVLRSTEDELKKRNPHYTNEQVNAYFSSYDAKMAKMKATGTVGSALIKQAQRAGESAALSNVLRPTQDKIKARHPQYADEHAQAYLNAYDSKRAKMKAKEPIGNEISHTLAQFELREALVEVESLSELPQTPTAFLYNFARKNTQVSILNNNNFEEGAFVFSPLSRARI